MTEHSPLNFKDFISLRGLGALGFILSLTVLSYAQNSNQSTTTTRQRTTTTDGQNGNTQGNTNSNPARTRQKGASRNSEPAGESGVIAAFDALINGIQHADVNAVTSVYWNSPQLVLFNNNGTVTKGWEQLRKNREASYPQLKNVKINIRDRRVEMLGTVGAVVTCLWSQSDTFRGASETATGRMTIVFRRTNGAWKAIHLHTSPDRPDPSRISPSDQTPASPDEPAPENKTPSPKPSPTPKSSQNHLR